MDWNEFFIVGLLALCVLGPIVVVLLTQNFFDSADDVASEHFDLDAPGMTSPFSSRPPDYRRDQSTSPPLE